MGAICARATTHRRSTKSHLFFCQSLSDTRFYIIIVFFFFYDARESSFVLLSYIYLSIIFKGTICRNFVPEDLIT